MYKLVFYGIACSVLYDRKFQIINMLDLYFNVGFFQN